MDKPGREELFGYTVEGHQGDGAEVEALISSGVEVISGQLEVDQQVVPMVGVAFRVVSSGPKGIEGTLPPVLMAPDAARAVAVQLVDSANICDGIKEDE